MSTALTTIAPRLPKPLHIQGLSDSQWRVLTDAIFPTAQTTESVMLALDYCRARNLDPFKRPVHVVPMWSQTLKRMVETVWPGINELQVTAARSKSWAGMDEPRWGPMTTYEFTAGTDDEGNASTVKVEAPEWCAVTVYRMIGDEKCAFTEPVYWSEAYGRRGKSDIPNDMWRKRPRGQLHKCAKAASLRAGFPEDLGSSYAAEEMEGKEVDGGTVIDGQPAEHLQHRHIQAEETSEFLVRAEMALTSEPNGTKWLGVLTRMAQECPTVDDLDGLQTMESVAEGSAKAPKLIKSQMEDLFAAARKRLAMPPASVAPTTTAPIDNAPERAPDPGADPAVADFIRSVRAMPTPRFKALEDDASHQTWLRSLSPEDYKLVQRAIADRVAAGLG